MLSFFFSATPNTYISSHQFYSAALIRFYAADSAVTFLPLPTVFLRLTSFDVDILAPNLARRVFCSAVVCVVMDQLAEAGRQEVEDLEGSVWVDMADAWDVVDLLAGRQIPAQRGGRRAPSRTGHRGPCGAGKYYLLQRCIDKI